MNTNTYRCGCGRILGYLPSGAKEACTACLQARREEAIAKAGARSFPAGRVQISVGGRALEGFASAGPVSVASQKRTMEAWLKAWPEVTPPSRENRERAAAMFGVALDETPPEIKPPAWPDEELYKIRPVAGDRLAYALRAAERCFRAPIQDAHDDREDLPRLAPTTPDEAREVVKPPAWSEAEREELCKIWAQTSGHAWMALAVRHTGLERLPDETDAAFRRRLASAYLAA